MLFNSSIIDLNFFHALEGWSAYQGDRVFAYQKNKINKQLWSFHYQTIHGDFMSLFPLQFTNALRTCFVRL